MSTFATLGGPLGLCKTIRGQVAALTDSSRVLVNALVRRDVDRCWELMALQESQSGELRQSLQLWQELFGGSPASAGNAVAIERQLLQDDLRQLQQLARENAVLSRGFAGVVRRVLDGISHPPARQGNLYGRYGRRPGAGAAKLVRSVG